MTVTDPISGQNVPSRSRRQTLFLPCLGQGTPRIDVMGDTPVLSGTLSATGDANGIMAKITCPASINAVGGIVGDVQYTRINDIQAYVNYKFNHLTNTRIFIGFSAMSLSTMLGYNSPLSIPGQFFGLFFSDTFSPSSLYAISSDGGHTPVIRQPENITPLTVDAGYHRLFLRLFADGGSAQVQLQVDDNTMNGISGSGLVPQTTPLAFMAGMITKDGGAKSFQLGKIQIESA